MNRTATFALLIVSFLLLSSAAQAELIINKYTNDFTLTSPDNEQIKLCSCETRVDKLIVENTGNFESSFTLEVRSDYPRKIRMTQDSFTLAPRQFKEVLVYIEDSCGVEGVFDYTVLASNSYGRDEQLVRTIRADACQLALIDVTPADRTVGLCEDATFKATITNVAPYAETFTLGVGQYDAAASYPRREAFLQPGESFTQDVTFSFPCADYGVKTLDFSANAGKEGLLAASAQRTLTIRNDFDYALDISTGMQACAQTTTMVPLRVENEADAPDEIRLTLDAPGFVTFADGSREMTLGLDRLEDAQVQLSIAPGQASVGEHTVSVRALDLYGGVAKTRDTRLTVENCFDPALEMRPAPQAEPISMDKDCCGEKTYYVNVRNDGTRTQTFQLRLDGPDIFTLEETTVRLAPSQNVNVELLAQLPCTDETYSASVTAWPSGAPQANATATITVESLTQRACYMVQIDEDEVTVRDDAPLVPMVVRHTGIRAGNYTITTDSDVFALRESQIELFPGEQKAVHLVPIANLTSQEKGRYLVLPTFTLEERGIPYNEFVGVQLRGKSMLESFKDWLFALSCAGWGMCAKAALGLLVFLAVLVIVLLVVYAGGFAISRGGMGRQALLLLRISLGVLIALLLLSLLFVQPPSRDVRFERSASGNATVLEWYQNEQLTVDLDPYFTDPDMDALTYTASQPSDVRASIEGSTLTLLPDHNFAGENTLVVSASDERGGIAESPTFLLRVIPKKELTFAEWVGVWCEYVIVALLVAILLVLLLMSLTIPQRRQDLKADNVIMVVPKDGDGSGAATGSAVKRVRKTRPRKGAKARVRKGAARAGTASRSARKAPARKKAKKGAKAAKASSTAKGARKGGSKAKGKGKAAKASTRSSSTKALVPSSRGEVVRAQPMRADIVRADASQLPASRGAQQQTVQNIVNVPGGAGGGRNTETVFVGSRTGNTVHTPYCMIARRIPKNKRVAFSSRKDAMDAGLVPCKGCRPF